TAYEIVELAAAQRIMHEMRARAGPEDHVRPPQIGRHLVALEHTAISDMAGDARLAVADDAVADFRPHSVAGDQRAACGLLAVLQRHGYAVAVILEGVDAAAGFQRDEVAALAGLEESRMDVGAVGHRIRLAEAGHELAFERNARDQLAGEGVAHFLGGRAVRVGEDGVLEADLLQCAEDIGAELNAGADLAELGRLL